MKAFSEIIGEKLIAYKKTAVDVTNVVRTPLGRVEIKVLPDETTVNIKIVIDDNFSIEKLGALRRDVISIDSMEAIFKEVALKLENTFEQETIKFR